MSDEFDPVLEKVFEDPLLHRPAPEGWIANALASVDTASSPLPDMSADASEVQVFEIVTAPVRSRTRWFAVAAAIAFVVIAGSILVQSSGRPSQTVVADAPTDQDTPVDTEANTSTTVDFNNEGPADPPVACFNLSSTEVFVGETVTITNCSRAFNNVSLGFEDGSPLEPLQGDSFTRLWDEAGTFVVTLEATGPGGSERVSRNVTVLASPSSPTGVQCQFSDFFDNNGVYTWSETWTWTVDPSIQRYEVEENQDGEFVRLQADQSGVHRTDGVNGQANAGRSLKAIVGVTTGGLELETQITNCGATGGTGWVNPD